MKKTFTMGRFEQHDHTIADNFRMEAVVGSLGQFERAFSIAFNDASAEWYAETKAFGLVFFNYLSDNEMANVNRPMTWPITTAPADKIVYEDYIIKHLPTKMSVGPAMEFTLDWLKEMNQDKFEFYAGPATFNWDIWCEFGVVVSTGGAFQQIGEHPGAICFVKPHWMYIGK